MASASPAGAEDARREPTGRTFEAPPFPAEAADGSPPAEAPPGPRRRGPRALVLVILLAAALAVATFWAGTRVHTRQAAIPHDVSEPIATVPIEHRRLVDLLDADGEVVRPQGQGVSPVAPELPAGTQPLVTRLPAHVGQDLHDGSEIAEVAGRPVFAFAGEIPMYRPLSTGDTGADVAQLQAALGRAGLPVGDPPGRFGPATGAALAALFLRNGYRIEDSAPPGGGAASAGDGAASPSGGATSPSGGAGSAPAPPPLTLAASSIVYVRQLPATVTAIQARVGARTPSGSILSLSTGAPIVRVAISAAQAQSVPRGAKARIAVGGRTLDGRVVGRRPAAGGGRLTLIVQPAKPLHGWIDRQVTVRIVKASTPHAVWVVPFSAVGTASDGSSFVEIVRGERRLRVPVRLGMTARGYVAVTALHGARFADGEVVAADA